MPDLSSRLPADSRARRHQLRRTMRQRRRALSPGQQRLAARRLTKALAATPRVRRARRIALYLPADGEIDARSLMHHAGFRQRVFLLPVLDPLRRGYLRFAPWRRGQPLTPNRFGIPEPRLQGTLVATWAVDVMLMPLVAFDDAGNRLGMGGGFYDRTLADMARRPRQPWLIGAAHHFQRVPRLETARWDKAMNCVITD